MRYIITVLDEAIVFDERVDWATIAQPRHVRSAGRVHLKFEDDGFCLVVCEDADNPYGMSFNAEADQARLAHLFFTQ